jgi:galactose mutarotase-like enzyme
MVEKKETDGLSVVEFKLGPSRFQLAPEAGFRLMRWTLDTASSSREILHWPADDQGHEFGHIRGGNPILFPFCGRSFDRGLIGNWRGPDRERRPMPLHGFACNSRFSITDQGENHITGTLLPDAGARECYPFDYNFCVTYTFEELSIAVTLALENKGADPIPWSAGHHFYFTLPWHDFARRKDYQINLEARKCAYHAPDGKLAMQKDRESCHDLSNPELFNRIHWELRHNRVSFGPKGGEEDVHLIIGSSPVPEKSYSIVTWSESDDEPYYCIEPWMGPPNAVEHGKGLHWVGPGESASFDVEVSLY